VILSRLRECLQRASAPSFRRWRSPAETVLLSFSDGLLAFHATARERGDDRWIHLSFQHVMSVATIDLAPSDFVRFLATIEGAVSREHDGKRTALATFHGIPHRGAIDLSLVGSGESRRSRSRFVAVMESISSCDGR
jgi:hypothetical protein